MPVSLDFIDQLRAPWEQASGALIAGLSLMGAQLGPITNLTDSLSTTVSTISGNTVLGANGYPASSVLTTDSASVPTFSQFLPGPLGFASGTILSPAALSGPVNDYNPTGLSSAAIVRLTSGGSFNITGLHAATGSSMKVLVNVSAFAIGLTHQDISSSAANRWRCPASVTFALLTNQAIWIWYDTISAVWQVVA